jgi:hypothetical protein
LPYNQYLENFSSYVAEIHAVFQVSFCQSLVSQKEFGDEGQISVTNVRTHGNSSGSSCLLDIGKRCGKICSFIFATFLCERPKKGHTTLQWDTQ